ncbi:ATP-binding protein [Frondihabitans australicus]|uniref:Magnesium chelatase subunit ChlI-like protein n=1 Tax=Frondihabitans australicus TaxID=386892 RepID=A0A495IF83_9MICO|nr:ATP-binding protein [Frondihabitans australicus]RKR74657.1 magnesium chelatase subunit ChlI-like protein [Frondihabitans australicus]
MPDLDIAAHAPELAARALASAAGGRVVVLIDGRSGSGKSTLAAALTPLLPGAQLVALDDVYPGWEGLAAASEAVPRDILRDVDPGYRRWDWAASAPGAWRALSATAPIVVEGAGAVTPASAALATLRIWVDLDDETRKARALARDGAAYEPWWDLWAAQELTHLARHDPRSLADVTVVG